MSTILKALKRLDDERRAEAPGRTLEEQVLGGASAVRPERRRIPWLALLLGLLGVGVASGLGYWLAREAVPRDAAKAQASEPSAAPSAVIAAPQPSAAPSAVVAAPQPSAVPVAAAPAPPTEPSAALAPSELAVPASSSPTSEPAQAAPRPKKPPEPRLAARAPDPAPVVRAPAPEQAPPSASPSAGASASAARIASAPLAEQGAPPPASMPEPAPESAPEPAVAVVAPRPEVWVDRTQWHPTPEKRRAWIRVGAGAPQQEAAEGDAIDGVVVHEIKPSAVILRHAGDEWRRGVGSR